MTEAPTKTKFPWPGLGVVPVLAGLLAMARYNYLLFHSLVEMFAVIVAGSMFMVAWNARRMRGNDFLLFLGVAYLFVGGLDLLHTLAYQGMGVFPGSGANLASQLWIAARTMESLALLAAPHVLTRRLAFGPMLAGGALLTAALLAAIFVWPIFPVCYIDGVGLTLFKIAGEYSIITVLLAALLFFVKQRLALDPKVLRQLCLAIVCSIAAELAFTLYIGVYDLANQTGHLLKLASFSFVYLAIVRKGFTEPKELLFHELSQSEKALRLSEQKFRSLVDNLGAGVALISPAMEILSVNPQMRKWFPNIDPARKPICYKAFNDPPRQGICSYCPTRQTLQDGLVHEAITATPAGAETRHFHVVATPLKDEAGQMIGVIESVDDITEFKRAEQKLAQYAERMAILQVLDQDILAAREPKALARAALAHLRKMIPCDGCCILLFDHEHRVTVPLALLAEFDCPFKQDDTLAFQCETFLAKLKAGETITVGEVTHPAPCAVQEALRAAGLLSFVAVPLMEKETLIGMLGLFARSADFFRPEHLELAKEVAAPVAIALGWARLMETLARQRRQFQDLASRLATAEQNLRRGLARELHDTVGQELSALGLQLSIVRHVLPPDSDPMLDQRLETATGIVEQTIEQVRTIMSDLRPPVLDDCGLAAALRWEGERVTEYYGPALVVRVTADESPPPRRPDQEIALFRIAQEAIMNAVKHAKAATIAVRLQAEADRLTLLVTDDGQGFTPGRPESEGSRQRLGLISMRERAMAIGGRLSIDSKPGRGATIRVEVDIP